MTPFTDIVIGMRATRQYPAETDFRNCIESLVAHTSNFRLILVDDNSDEQGRQEIERLAELHPSTVLIRTHTQNWFTRAYNKGLRLVRTERAIMLNGDTVLDDGWLDELHQVMDEVTQVRGRVGLVGSIYPADSSSRWRCTNGRDYVTGHCWLVSMTAFAEVAASRGMPGWYLDETRLENAHIRSDVEMCWTLNRLGYQTVVSHQSKVGHLGGRSWGHNIPSVNMITMEQLKLANGQ